MRKLLLVVIIMVMAVTLAYAQKEELKPDDKVVELINAYLQAQSIPDFEESARAVAKLTQISLTINNGTELNNNLKIYGFKKDHTNVKLIEQPAKIVKIDKMKTTEFGWDAGKQKGSQYKYYLAKKSGKGSASITVFVPDDGSDPKISNMGNFK